MGIMIPSETYGDNFERSIEPMFPKIGDTWIDTSAVPEAIRKVYTSTGWVEVSFQFHPPPPAPGNRGVFGGGNDGNSIVTTIDYIDILSKSDAQNFSDLTEARRMISATSNGTNNRGVFEGGHNSNVIDYIDISTKSDAQDFGDLTEARSELTATSNGTNNRGVFGGGWDGSHSNVIDYIDISSKSNAQDFGDLRMSVYGLAATSNGTNNRGVFGGGKDGDYNVLNTIDYIDISTPANAQDLSDLTVSRDGLTATSNGTNNRGVFGGGKDGNYDEVTTIDYIDISTPGNAQNFGDLIEARDSLAATSNGTNNRGVFGGGDDGSDELNVIDYIDISTPANVQDFGDLTVGRYFLAATSNGLT